MWWMASWRGSGAKNSSECSGKEVWQYVCALLGTRFSLLYKCQTDKIAKEDANYLETLKAIVEKQFSQSGELNQVFKPAFELI